MPDIKQSIATISATPFPPKILYTKISTANKRVQELEAELAAVKGQMATATPTPAAHGQSAKPDAGFTATARLFTAMLRMKYVDRSLLAKSEGERRLMMATIAWQNRLTYPGCQSDFAAIDTSKVKRNVPDSIYSGLDRAATAIRQTMFEKEMQ
jgi:hypothetical protein